MGNSEKKQVLVIGIHLQHLVSTNIVMTKLAYTVTCQESILLCGHFFALYSFAENKKALFFLVEVEGMRAASAK